VEPAASPRAPEPGPRTSVLRRHPRLAALAIALALLLGADLALGAWLIRPSAGSFRCPHPYYHHGFRPNVSTTARWGTREYAMHTNSLGFRDRAPREVPLVPDGRRILLMGDSFVEGIGVPWEETFVAHLEEGLRGRAEVLDAGAVSYAPMIYRLKTEYLLEDVGLRFDELVVFVDISDVQDEVNYQSFRPRRPGALDRAVSGVEAVLARRSWTYDTLAGYLRQERGGVSNALDADTLAENEIYFRDLEAYGEGKTQAEVEMGRWEWTIAPPLMEAWGKKGLELAKADMQALVALCRARGIGVRVCVYPSPVQILMKDRDSIQVSFWREFCQAEDVELIDLFPTFLGKDAGRPRAVYNEYFIPGDMHWNAAGHRLVAAALLERL